jgi:hypothetical protein
MSMQSLQEFIERHVVAAGSLTALCAALDAKVSGTPLDPVLAARVQQLLETVGAGDVLNDIAPQEAAPILSMLRAMYLLDSKLLFAHSRTQMWNHAETEILQSIGDAARMHAQALTRAVVPACEGLSERMRAPGAAFIDIGVGVAGTAIAMAQMWPELRLVGIDPWQPSLRLARENVDQAGLRERIELREQSVEALDDQAAFDLAWFAIPFIPERCVRPGCERTLKALRPGGWITVAPANYDGMKPPMAALARLRVTQWGGPVWSAAEVEKVLRETGFVDVRSLPTPPGSPAALIVGRRPPA